MCGILSAWVSRLLGEIQSWVTWEDEMLMQVWTSFILICCLAYIFRCIECYQIFPSYAWSRKGSTKSLLLLRFVKLGMRDLRIWSFHGPHYISDKFRRSFPYIWASRIGGFLSFIYIRIFLHGWLSWLSNTDLEITQASPLWYTV